MCYFRDSKFYAIKSNEYPTDHFPSPEDDVALVDIGVSDGNISNKMNILVMYFVLSRMLCLEFRVVSQTCTRGSSVVIVYFFLKYFKEISRIG